MSYRPILPHKSVFDSEPISRVAGRFVAPFIWAVMFLSQAQAANPEHVLTQYAHTAWRVQDGFFSAPPLAIGQSLDGQLWIGGEGGLVRFDGVQFTPWKPPQGTRLRSERIYSLLGSRDGSMWIGTGSGLARWKDGKLSVYAEVGLFGALLEDGGGTVWAGHIQSLDQLPPLCRFSASKFDCFAVPNQTGLPVVMSLEEDRQGNLWIGGDGVICRWQGTQTDCQRIPAPVAKDAEFPINSITGDSRGNLWVDAGSTGVWRYNAGQFDHSVEFPKLPLQGNAGPRRPSDSLWISGIAQGLIRSIDGGTDRFAPSDGLSGDTVSSVFEDREGSVWVTTSGGLDRFRDVRVATLTPREGLNVDETTSIAASRDGSVWISGENTLLHLRDGRFKTYPARSTFGTEAVAAVLEDSRGRLWVGAGDRLFRRENGRFPKAGLLLNPKVRRTVRVRTLAEDVDGTIWAGTTDPDAVLVHVADDRILESFRQDQVGGAQVTAMAADAAGGMWLGQPLPRLTLYRNGRFEIRADSFPDRTRTLFVDARGVWAATNKGLALYRNGKVALLSVGNGLPCDDLITAVRDVSDALWLKGPCGLMQIVPAELDAWVSDPARRVQVRLLDALDGARAGMSDYSPREARSADGRLWFANHHAGVQVVDPTRLAEDLVAPVVAITSVMADRKTYETGTMLRLAPLTRDIEIGYTAYRPAMPERVQFRYRLQGADNAWRDAGHRREAFFSRLGPGRYRFEVLGANGDGNWGEQPASLEFEIAAAFYQTWWFRLVVVAALAGALWSAYRWRVRHLARQFDLMLEARVSERTLIARELHDTLLQSFQGLLMRFQTAYDLFQRRPAEARQTLASAIDQAIAAIGEGRDAVQGLRASAPESNDLALAIQTFSEQLASEETSHGAVALKVVVEGTPKAVHPILRDEIYRIASEALRNAFRHAMATQIEVELRYANERLRLRVRDDGKGMDPEFLGGAGREGHFGLPGMRERAKLIGGELTVWSASDSGTEVDLSIPGWRAYAAPLSPRRSWFAGKFSTKSTSRQTVS